jgi:copper homeostasis protein
MRAVRQRVRIPIHVMIRPRSGDFCYSRSEFEIMNRGIVAAKEVGFSGVVLGILDSSSRVDEERTRALVELAHPLPVTFHRAFDQSADLTAALEAVIRAGAKRILTSGGAASAMDGLASLTNLVRLAGERIVIMPGGGIRSENVERILRSTGAREIHTSLGASDAKSSGTRQMPLFEARVRTFKHSLDSDDTPDLQPR